MLANTVFWLTGPSELCCVGGEVGRCKFAL